MDGRGRDFELIPDPVKCSELCGLDQSCAYWEFDFNNDRCTLYETSERRCQIYFLPNHVDVAKCSDGSLNSDCEQVRYFAT